ncbi:MAG TPA: hypothetical protein PLV66_11410 [Thermoanaerobaculales bacterium]|nr:hypothetical protein [Thermoanaerobaculales bacterium]
MKLRNLGLLMMIVCSAGVALPWAAAGPTEPAAISPDQAAAIAVNRLEPTADGVVARHPRRTVEFAPEGVLLHSRGGAPSWRWTLEAITTAGGRPIVDSGPVAPVAVERDLVRYDRCALLEDYRLQVSSFEQLFVIPEPLPLGGEDLVVAGAVSCDGDLSETDEGWAWRAARGEVTLGRVTVLGADGEPIPARFEVSEGATRIVVDGGALLAAAYPVTIDPEIGSNDYRISDMGPNGDPAYDAFDAAVAYNSINNTYLVVWAGDDTTGGLVDEEYEIFGQILSAHDTQLGYNDVRISSAGGTGSYNTRTFNPDVAFNSVYNEFLVVWSADNPEDGCVDNEFEIWGQVVDEAIFPLYGDNFRISFNGGTGNAGFDADYPAVVYNPDVDEYLVVWEADDTVQGMVDNEVEIFAQRVYSTGILIGSNLRMSDMGGSGDSLYDAFEPSVAYDDQNFEYCVVWYGDDDSPPLVNDEYEIYGQKITWDGVGTGPNDFRISDMGGSGDLAYDAYDPSIAYNPAANEYFVVWQGDDNVEAWSTTSSRFSRSASRPTSSGSAPTTTG